MTYDVNNKQQEMAYQLIKDTNVSFFLTGKAGTGKTTFLKKIQEEINKNFIVLAPTGIAAINAGGDTIHSFFGLPFSVITFKEVGKVRSAKIELLRNVDTLIIDEYQDINDEIAELLKYIRSQNPGLQIVAVGDMKQKIYDDTALDVWEFMQDFLGYRTVQQQIPGFIDIGHTALSNKFF